MEGVAEEILDKKGILMNNSAVFFGAKSAYYDQNAKIQNEIAKEAVSFYENNFFESKNYLWLDLGSGTGFAQKELKKKNDGIEIISLDISFLPFTKNKNTVCGDFDYIPFSDNSFDGIISCSALQWSKNIKNALQNSFNVLKIGAKFISAVFGNETLRELRFLQKKFDIKPQVLFYEQEYFEKALREIGFDIVAKNKKTFSQKFSCAYDALKSISQIGATSHDGKILLPKMLKEFIFEYEKLFDGKEIIHEYETFFYISEKK